MTGVLPPCYNILQESYYIKFYIAWKRLTIIAFLSLYIVPLTSNVVVVEDFIPLLMGDAKK